MKASLLALGAALAALAGCTAASPATEPVPNSPPPGRFVGWRLSERCYGALDESWARAGDAAIDPDSTTLAFEAVFEEEANSAESTAAPSGAKLRTRLDGPAACGVGDRVRVLAWVDGSTERSYVLRIEPTSPRARLRNVEGAIPLAGQPGCWLFAPGEKAAIEFSSTGPGLEGLRIALERELAVPVGRSRPN